MARQTYPEFKNYVVDKDVDGKHIDLALWDTARQDNDHLRLIAYTTHM